MPSPNQVLRYWLAMIRREEALSLKIRAAPPQRGPTPAPRVRDPDRGQPYFKLLGDEASPFLLHAAPSLNLPVTQDRVRFFEHWLNETYRRQRFRRSIADSDQAMPLMVGFPVFYDPRNGLLRTLLRFPVEEFVFLDAVGADWEAPTAQRRRGETELPPPAQLQLRAPTVWEELPYSLDETTASHVLGIQEERLGQLSAALAQLPEATPHDLIAWTVGLLQAQTEGPLEAAEGLPAEPMALVRQLTELCAACLGESRTRVWPIGLAYDAGNIFATHYLQQDLRDLLAGRAEIKSWSPLNAYLTAKRARTSLRAHIGARQGRAPTPSQRSTAQRFLGSALTAAQGPPGTGKTELIGALAAHTLIERMAQAGTGTPPRAAPSPLLVVASTNNRAVDNVIDPLHTDLATDRLPVALRLGSRPVVESVTISQLQRTRRWLRQARDENARERYDALREVIQTAWATLQTHDAELRACEHSVDMVEAAEVAIEKLRPRVEEARLLAQAEPDTGPADRIRHLQDAAKTLATLRSRLDRDFSKALTAKPPALRKLKAAWRTASQSKAARALLSQCQPLDLGFELPTEPDTVATLDAWLEVLDETTDSLETLGERLAALTTDAIASAGPSLETLEAKLAAAEDRLAQRRALQRDPQEAIAALGGVVEALEPGLFEKALELRELWAILNRDRLLRSVDTVLRCLAGAPSLRRLQQREEAAYLDLKRLFPVWGCTLLSMGNAFPMESGLVDRLVIDEAGQCHPAHAIGALYRAERCLIIGDRHQLQPVIELDRREEARILQRLALNVDPEALDPFRVTRSSHNSAQTLAERACDKVPTLREHFRCQPAIIAVSDTLCNYDLVVRTAPRALAGTLARGAMLGIAVSGEQQAWLGSWKNDAELAAVVQLVRHLQRQRVRPDQMAVLTPYRGQLQALRTALRKAGVPLDNSEAAGRDWDAPSLFDARPRAGVAVGTVHRFQGGERDVVIFSSVVTRRRSLTFLNERVNLINVAISRARHHFVLVGDPRMLAQGPVTEALVNAIPKAGWLDPR